MAGVMMAQRQMASFIRLVRVKRLAHEAVKQAPVVA